MKVSCDVSCVQLAMRHCHNAENGGNNRDGGSKQCAFPGRIRRSPRNERGFVAGSLSAVCLGDTYVEAGELKNSGSSWARTRTPEPFAVSFFPGWPKAASPPGGIYDDDGVFQTLSWSLIVRARWIARARFAR